MKREEKIKKARRLVILFSIQEQDDFIDLSQYQQDIDLLLKEGLIEENKEQLELTPQAEEILKKITFTQKKEVKRFFWWQNQ